MTKRELIAQVSEKTGTSIREAERMIGALCGCIIEELKQGGRVQIPGFGTFEVTTRAERQCRNPQTGATIVIAASKTPKFKAGKTLKDQINS